jgi:iron complex outermembrane recepter protein
MVFRAKIGLSLYCATAIVAGEALAQDAEGPSAAGAAGLTEVVVTAQRREEREHDVPMTITTATAAQLEKAGVETVGELSRVVPAFEMNYQGVYSQPTIRGVSTSVAGVATGSAVGIYVDGFFVPSPLTSDFDLLNVTSIQVLKGPQGTLFGRNTTAGAILVTTSEPSVNQRLDAKVSYGRYNEVESSFYGTTGVTDRAAVDIAASYRRGDGFIHNIVTGSDHDGEYDSFTVRTGFKYLFNDEGTDSVLFRFVHGKTIDPSLAAQTVYNGESIGSVIPGTPVASRRGQVSSTDNNFFDALTDAGYLTGRFDLGFANLTSYSMYRDERAGEGVDFDGTPIPAFYALFKATDETFTQEIDLNSKPGTPLTWVVGAYYFNELGQWPYFRFSAFGAPLTELWNTSNRVTSTAVFADATYKLVDRLSLTAGIRYSHEHDNAFYNLALADAGLAAGLYPAQQSWNSVTPRGVIRYDFDSSSNVYASITRGYKAGFLNPNGLTTTPVEPEQITAYEGGYKYSRGPTRFEASAFKYRYRNLQVATYNGQIAIVTNAAQSSIYGGELAFSTLLGQHLELSLGGAYTHAEYERYTNAPSFSQILNPTNPAFGTFATTSVNASSNVMLQAPRFSGNASLDYTTPLAGGSVSLNANFAYQSKVYFDPANQFPQGGYGRLNLRGTWTTPSGHWSFSVFGNNVTDRTYRRTVFPTPFAVLTVYGEPVTYGGSVALHF